MRFVLILLLVTMVTAGEEQKPPLERLAKTGVASRAVGYAGTPSEFYRIFAELRESADDALVKRFLAHENPVFRCMGLTLHLHRNGRDAVPELRRRIGDRGAISLQVGCVGSASTVGGFARRLLHYPNLVDETVHDAPRSKPGGTETPSSTPAPRWGAPLLPAKALRALDFEILAREDTVGIRREARPGLSTIKIEFEKLRAICPTLSDRDLVKAVARQLGVSSGTLHTHLEGFLIEVSGDAALPREVRLAALAGISASGSRTARTALDMQDAFLKETGETRLIGRAERRAAVQDLVTTVFATPKTKGIAAIEKAPAIRKGDPAALRVLENVIGDARVNDRPVPTWVTPALGRIVARAEAGFPAWDPDSDLRYRLEAFLWGEGCWLMKHAPSKALKEIEARVAKLVAN